MTATQITNHYRATIILDMRGHEESVEKITEKLKATLAAVDATVTADKSLGQKDFIRVTDRKNPNGIYLQIHFDGPSAAPLAFREKLRLDRSIKRIFIQTV